MVCLQKGNVSETHPSIGIEGRLFEGQLLVLIAACCLRGGFELQTLLLSITLTATIWVLV